MAVDAEFERGMSELVLRAPGPTHAELVLRASSWLINRQNCRFALREVSVGTGECPDAIGWKYGDQSHLVEVKVSRSDFFADRDKSFRKEPARGVGLFRWYMVPAGLLTVEDVAEHAGWGLLEVRGRSVHQLRRAEAQPEINKPAEVSILVQAVANAQLCAPMDLNDWFASPETCVGRVRKERRRISAQQRESEAERACGYRDFSKYNETHQWPPSCETRVAVGYSYCSEHGGRTRGEKRKQAEVAAAFEFAQQEVSGAA